MARLVIDVLPALVVLYVTFLLGQRNGRRQLADVVDPRPVIAALRNLLVVKAVENPNEFSLRSLQAHEALAAYDRPDLHT